MTTVPPTGIPVRINQLPPATTVAPTDIVPVFQGGVTKGAQAALLSAGAGVGGLFVTPEQYGAKGDGVTNDSTAIQNALNSGFAVWFSRKTYVCKNIQVPAQAMLVGAHANYGNPGPNNNGTVLQAVTNGDDILLLGGDAINFTAGMNIRHISFSGGRRQIWSKGNVSDIIIGNCTFGPNDTAIHIDGTCTRGRYYDCYFQGGNYGVYATNGVIGDISDLAASAFYRCVFGGMLKNWFFYDGIQNTVNLSFMDIRVGAIAEHGFNVASGASMQNVNFTNCSLEGVGQWGIPAHFTTGTIFQNDNQLTLAGTTGFSGAAVTIQGAGASGVDLQATITGLTGNIATLNTTAGFSSIAGEVTTAQFDEWHFDGNAGDVVFLNCTSGNGGSSSPRYSVLMHGYGLFQQSDLQRPIYQGNGSAAWGIIGGAITERLAPGNPQGLGNSFVISNTIEIDMRLATYFGGNINLMLGDTNNNGSGSFGSLTVQALGNFGNKLTILEVLGGTASRVASGVRLSAPLAHLDRTISTPTTGQTITIGDRVGRVILNPAGTLANLSVVMYAHPIDGQDVEISSTQIITSLTLSPNSGQTIVAPQTSLAAGRGIRMTYDLANTRWLPVE